MGDRGGLAYCAVAPETILGVYLAVGAEVVFFDFAAGDCIGFAGYAKLWTGDWVEIGEIDNDIAMGAGKFCGFELLCTRPAETVEGGEIYLVKLVGVTAYAEFITLESFHIAIIIYIFMEELLFGAMC